MITCKRCKKNKPNEYFRIKNNKYLKQCEECNSKKRRPPFKLKDFLEGIIYNSYKYNYVHKLGSSVNQHIDINIYNNMPIVDVIENKEINLYAPYKDLKKLFDKCYVCYEKNNSIICCHKCCNVICFSCYDKINNKCPMCRNNNFYDVISLEKEENEINLSVIIRNIYKSNYDKVINELEENFLISVLNDVHRFRFYLQCKSDKSLNRVLKIVLKDNVLFKVFTLNISRMLLFYDYDDIEYKLKTIINLLI